MKGSAFLPILVAGLTPLAVLILIVTATAFGPVAWKPPIIWMDTFGSGPPTIATAIASDQTGLYVQGCVNCSSLAPPESLILGKYTFDGGLSWMRTIGNSSEVIDGLSVASDGIYLTGGNVMGGTVQKYDKTGSQMWAEKFGSIPANEGRAISATSTGVYVAGYRVANDTARGFVVFVREYDLLGSAIWTADLTNASGLVNGAIVSGVYAASSGIFVVGSVFGTLQGSTRIGDNDAFLVKYDLNGGLAWTRQFGTPRFETAAYGVSGDSSGVYVSGTSMSSTYGFLRKYGFDGKLAWADQIESPDSSAAGRSSIAVDSSGVYFSEGTSGSRQFIMKYDLNGGRLWNFQMQSSARFFGPVMGYHLAAGTGGVYVAGSLPDLSAGMVAEVSSSPSLVFFGINPPLSFVLVGALVAGAATSIFFFRRLRRSRLRPPRVRPSDRSLQVRD